MVPNGWKKISLGDCSRFLSGNTPSKERADYWGGQFPWVTAKDMKSLCLEKSELRLTEQGKTVAAIAPANSILVLTRGMTLLKDLPVGLASRELAFNQDVKALIAKPEIDPWFLAYQLVVNKREILDLVDTAGHGTGRLDTELLKQFEILLPSKKEQEKIASMIRVWDQAITISEKLLANSRKQKQTLIQELLTGKRRFRQHSQWAKKKLSDLIVESRLPGSRGGIAKKITVKLYGKGVVAKEERRAGSDATQYYRRKAGQFIYSKLDFLNGAFGLIPAKLDGYESTLDLPAFDFLDGVDPRWFLYYVSREEFYQRHLGLANGGRKARRVNPSDLLKIIIEVPAVAEQRAIADAVDTAVAEETAWSRMTALLKAQKQALMADLLTGKRRVRLQEPKEETAA